MGIHDRDYSKRHVRSRLQAALGQGVTWLIVANTVGFVLQSSQGFMDQLWLDPARPFEVWRWVGAGFCHPRLGGLGAFGIRMAVLWWFGGEVEAIVGTRRLLGLYLLGEVAGSISFLGFSAVTGNTLPAVGASAGTFTLLMVCLLVYPGRQMFRMLDIRIAVGIVAVFDLLPLFTDPRHPGEVAYASHAGALLFGAVWQTVDWRRLLTRKRMRLVEPTPDPVPDALEVEVDALLAKIAREGEDSLTDEERKTLADASRAYRDRSR